MTENRSVVIQKYDGDWRIFRRIDKKKYKTNLKFNSKYEALNQAIIISRREGCGKVIIK